MKKYIFGAVLSIGLLVSPAFTQAAGLTAVQVNAILSILSSFGADQSVIVNVKTALSGTSIAVTGQFCHNFNSDLTIGSSGDDVVTLNRALSLSGIDTASNSSSFTEDNAGDVFLFQAKYGIRQTGYVGPITRAKLNALYGCRSGQQSTEIALPTAPTVIISPYMTGGVTYTAPVVDNTQTSINVLYPTAGMTFVQGQPITVTWQSVGNSNANYSLSYRTPSESGGGEVYTATQAHCDAADKCYVSWAPKVSGSNVTIAVYESVSGASGASGSFTIVAQPATTCQAGYIPSDRGCSLAAPNSLLTASPSTITAGSPVDIQYQVSNASYCTASGGWSGTYNAPSGSYATWAGDKSFYPTQTTTYSFTCYSSNGSYQTQSTTVTVNPAASATTDPNGASPLAVYYANPQIIHAGQTSILTLTSENTSQCSIPGTSWPSGKVTGNVTVSPMRTTTYVATCTGTNGTTMTMDVHVNVVVPVTTTSIVITSPLTAVAGAPVTISGTTLLTDISFSIDGGLVNQYGGARVSNGTWSVSFQSGFPVGSYFIALKDSSGNILTTGVLNVVR